MSIKDIYFDNRYGQLYEKMENGICEVFEIENEYGKIKHMYIKRSIPHLISGERYYDIVTPYGYGGPIIIKGSNETKEFLLYDFKKKFKKYCIEQNIVSEFIRFHPMLNNAQDFNICYDTLHIRNTVGTNLGRYEDPFQEEFSKSCRKNIRKALKEGVEFKVTHKPEDIRSFIDIYYSTMDRNNAADYYYFDEEYFSKCLDAFQENIILVEAIYNEQVIAMGFYFVFDKFIHIHLSGTLSEFLYLSPAYVLRYAITLWGKENGYKYIHHGGGRTSDPSDTLYKFKKQFGKNTEFEFYVGKQIWNQDVYDQLCEINNIDQDIEFFPAYRSN
ncbi:peptidoglycan bridge formation glycyltransferase FemA/FemB family protein [Ornithinibacillus sp. 4-3]|uniref:Lipid II:glycine glycyltransferase n=1 Tax=Ornithinibacillus sp. 4-3 TaxID=3231488 RepID=A0AB39HLW2_9BACI